MAKNQSQLEYARRSTSRVGRATHADSRASHLILYDGVCGLCDRLIQFALLRDRLKVLRFASIQSATGRRVLKGHGRNPDHLTTFYVVSNFESEDSAVLQKSEGILFVVSKLGWPWKLSLILRPLPLRLRDWGYDLVAKTRYRIFGRYDTCPIPNPAYRDRFLDLGD